MNPFLECGRYVDFDAENIRQKAARLFAGKATDIDKARAAFYFVRDETPHSFDCNADIITAAASQVLAAGTGICHAKANLLAALLRSQGIAAGFAYQHITLLDDASRGYCLHCYNAVLLGGSWIRLDARGNTGKKDAQFSLGAPRLAFENRPEYDEYYFPGIYAAPDMPTMTMLGRAKTLEEVMDGLPEFPAALPDIRE